MLEGTRIAPLLERASGGLPVPRAAKAGALVIVLGLALDAVEHVVVGHAHDELVAGFPLGEHAAHLVVVIGMVLVLGGIVWGGIRSGRTSRPEGSARDAVR